jgi:hypothetical protein
VAGIVWPPKAKLPATSVPAPLSVLLKPRAAIAEPAAPETREADP